MSESGGCHGVAGGRRGVSEERVLFDLPAFTVSADASRAMVTLKTIQGIKASFPSARTVERTDTGVNSARNNPRSMHRSMWLHFYC
jgi:hypothetical protein